ncbi:MAG: hypothetical protein A3C02_03580 [Candidatus Andersenbacteria bacterium RIFCSPHIGHO2_02_FULL_45_11]|uniref:Diaminopimelate epimerase n=1 Tax=Candidatus Andersenbacteria bacterium RIFCSPHIGHO2_12_FULL_45_11 TaxID=1797281 RepID=A0A1G1X500_9BACT|nr:MAG: hypothetical protein A2805_03520 [Candidatus Andersenbacteria bacterium RIFCSPHIGHO2_01_FULL_46_36]OGY32081.1 MAG: hypothetical protein A3C02_03580 [Candidatus Andersenbacteria bacterium RIFCSPHIGHO2_02_FULL_45_11]OGY35043.1 MAG: hypothetical protein A3D99_00685 [Candidatus Andersenbacteria bacterium RIFCSPHIGHO2_12_FULL_45_11]
MKLWFGEACGNTFLVLHGDRNLAQLYLENIRRKRTWTFDTALILQAVSHELYDMEVVEKDGSQSSMCGNGLRVVGAALQCGYCIIRTGDSTHVVEKTRNGEYRAHMGAVRTGGVMKLPTTPTFNIVAVGGEPHAVRGVRDIHTAPLLEWGRIIVPVANCTLYEPLESRVLVVRTFERGVNAITQSCGTGACAVAQSWFELSGYGDSITLLAHTHRLHVHRVEDQLVLEGPAHAYPISLDRLGI